VRSQVNVGATFTVRLPFKSEFDSTRKINTELKGIPVIQIPAFNTETKMTVLLVEDDPNAIIYVKKLLNKFETDIVTNAEDAVRKASEKDYSFILMDINLRSGMDGVAATKEIKKMKKNKDVPIVAMTAYAMVGDKEEFIAAGCTHYISKPFDKEDFLALIGEVLKGA